MQRSGKSTQVGLASTANDVLMTSQEVFYYSSLLIYEHLYYIVSNNDVTERRWNVNTTIEKKENHILQFQH